MEAAIFGLLGVALGAALTTAREWWFQRRKDRRDAEYLAVQVVGLLDRYISNCANVVADDGLNEGQRDQNGYRVAQVSIPNFSPNELKVEWKTLPTSLMYEILDLPYRAEIASHSVAAASEHDHPPDFENSYEEREYQYSLLGLAAAQLAQKLRKHVGLPKRSEGDWDPVAFMSNRTEKIAKMRRERESAADTR